VSGEDFYTVEEAARALKLTPARIRQMLRDGEIQGVPQEEEGGSSGWKIPVRVIYGRDRPPVDRPESHTAGPQSRSSPEDIRGEEEPGPTPAQPRREDPAETNRKPAAPSPHEVTAEETARILKTSVDALLEAKDEAISDLRDHVAFLERQLEGRTEEIRRRDHIIAALTERIPPAIEAPGHQKSQGPRENTAQEPANVAPSGAGAPRTGPVSPRRRRALWRRVFGR
jgi:hypothetical protein